MLTSEFEMFSMEVFRLDDWPSLAFKVLLLLVVLFIELELA